MTTHRADAFGFMAGSATCWSCKQETPVLAIVLDRWQEPAEDDEEDIQDGDGAAKLSYIEDLNPEALDIYQATNPNMKFLASGTARRSYWANSCAHCDALQGDWYLHGADGPFFPQTAVEEAALTITWHEVPITASAGYSQSGWLDNLVARSRGREVVEKKTRKRRK